MLVSHDVQLNSKSIIENSFGQLCVVTGSVCVCVCVHMCFKCVALNVAVSLPGGHLAPGGLCSHSQTKPVVPLACLPRSLLSSIFSSTGAGSTVAPATHGSSGFHTHLPGTHVSSVLGVRVYHSIQQANLSWNFKSLRTTLTVLCSTRTNKFWLALSKYHFILDSSGF